MVNLRIEARGINPVLRAYRSVIPEVSNAQRIAGITVVNRLKTEAQQIIKSKAPKSSGRLAESLFIEQNQLAKGWKTTLSSTAPYAWKVESGHPEEKVPVNSDLLNWVERVLGPKAKAKIQRKRSMTVRRGRNPFYDTSQGMRFFQIPVERNIDYIDDVYREELNKILSKVR